MQAWVDSFYDIGKIKRILLIHKETGLCLLDPIVDKTMKANLVGALIQAITTFGLSLTESESSSYVPLDTTTSLQEITYRDFHIVVHDGKYTRNAIIFSQPPSGQLNKRLEQFTTRLEAEYADVLENWAGRLNVFGDAIGLIDEYFFITLRLPHIIQDSKRTGLSLSQAERVLFTIAKKFAATTGSFLVRDLLDKYQSEKGILPVEVFEAIFTLREKELIVPLHTDFLYYFTNNTAA